MVRKIAGILLLASAIAGASAPSAFAEKLGEKSFTVTVNSVLVNRQGGVTISGEMDCSEAVVSAFEPSLPPSGFSALNNVNWDAYQTVGRTKVVHASYRSGIAQPCYPGPHAWATLYGFPVGTTQWVYSPEGKFVPGKIHVEISAGPGLSIMNGAYCGPGITIAPIPCAPPGSEESVYRYYEAYAFSGWDVRASAGR